MQIIKCTIYDNKKIIDNKIMIAQE